MKNIPTTEQIKKENEKIVYIDRTTREVYSVKDKKQGFQNLLIFKGEGAAVRSFSHATKDPNSDFYKFPDDFELYYLGKIDIDTGLIDAKIPKLVASATEYVSKEIKNG